MNKAIKFLFRLLKGRRSRRLTDLPIDVLVHIIAHVPREQHINIACLNLVLRKAVVLQPRSVLQFIDLFPCSGHQDVPPIHPGSPVCNTLSNLPVLIGLAGPQLRELRLHAAVSIDIRDDALSRVSSECFNLQRLAFADGGTVSTEAASTLFSSLTSLQQIELGDCSFGLLDAVGCLPVSCQTVTLHTSQALVFEYMPDALQKIARGAGSRQAYLNLRLYLYADPCRQQTKDAITLFIASLCELEPGKLNSVSSLTLAINLPETAIAQLQTHLELRYTHSSAEGAMRSETENIQRSPTFLPPHASLRVQTAPHNSIFYPAVTLPRNSGQSPHSEVVTAAQLDSFVRDLDGGVSLRNAHTLIAGGPRSTTARMFTWSTESMNRVVESGKNGALKTVYLNYGGCQWARYVHGYSHLCYTGLLVAAVSRGLSSVETLRMSHATVCAMDRHTLCPLRRVRNLSRIQFVQTAGFDGGIACRSWSIAGRVDRFCSEDVRTFCEKVAHLLYTFKNRCKTISVISMERFPKFEDIDAVPREAVLSALEAVDSFCDSMPATDCSTLRAQFEILLREINAQS